MTDSNTLSDYNNKDFGKLTRYVIREQDHKYLTGFESTSSYPDTFCIECRNDHIFRGNFEDAITFIDLLPELFPEIFKGNRSISISINKIQEFLN
jgi:hypothetical protein